jgi:type II secretory pathway pseudopilin PulG
MAHGMQGPTRNERGIALVMALLVLLVISLLSATLMLSMNVETKVASLSTREVQALNIAEAGVAEAVARIRNGEIPTNSNPRQVAQIFNTTLGNVPVLGADSVALATRQPDGQWLQYTTAGKADTTLTVRYKTNNTNPPTKIYRFDPNLNPAVQDVSGFPIWVVTSTGRKGGVSRRIVTEVIQRPINVNAKGAFVADKGIDFSGNSKICGYNHDMDTPADTPARPFCNPYELGFGNCTGAWSSGVITSGGSAQQDGWPVANSPNQVGFYNGPWDALSMTQADFFSWAGTPTAVEPQNPTGVYYLDNNGASQDASGDFKYNGGTGEGMLYVDGDLSINGNFIFRGLLYVEGDLKINGNCWILGSLIVKGKSTIKIANGTCTVLFSEEAISLNIAKYGGQFVTLSWRESRPY